MPRYKLRTLLIVLALGSALAGVPVAGLAADEGGSLSIRFVVNTHPLESTRKSDNSLIVNKSNGGLQNVCVWLRRRPGDLFSVDEEKPRERPKREIRLSDGNFSPRIQILHTPQTLAIRNNDSFGYSVIGECSDNNVPFCVLLKPGDSYEKLIPFREDYPIRLRDSIHPCIGFVLALDQPHAGISDEDGTLTIAGIPKGNWPFVIWHERCGKIKKVNQAGVPIESTDGQFWFTIQAGQISRHEFAIESESLRLQ